MSIERDVKTGQNDLRNVSGLVGDVMAQFAKLSQNELDLAKAELGEKFQTLGRALGLVAGAAVLVIPAIGFVRPFVCADRGRLVAAVVVSDLGDELNRRGAAVSRALREASDTLVSEVGDTGAEAADRVKQAATDAAHAAMDKFS